MRSKVVLLIVTVMVVIAGCGKGQGAVTLQEGKKLLNSPDPQDWQIALERFKKSIEIEVRARNQMAIAYRKIALQKLERAQKGVSADKFDNVLQARIKTKLGIGYTAIHLFHDAVTNLREAVKITPNVKFLHYNLGLCYSQLSRSTARRWERDQFLDLAADSYKRALGIDRQYNRARYGLAIVELNRKNFNEAVRLLNELIKQEPKNIRAYYALARVYYEDKKYRQAIGTYRLLLELIPPNSTRSQKIRENIRKIRLLQAAGK